MRTVDIDTSDDESRTDVALVTEQKLFQHHIRSRNWNYSARIETMEFELTGDHLGCHFSVCSCTGSAATVAKN